MNDIDINESRKERTKYLVKILIFSFFYTAIQWILMPLSDAIQFMVFDKVMVENWGIGLFFMVLFMSFFIINELPLFIFRTNKINKILILFWFSWVLADWNDFISTILNIVL